MRYSFLGSITALLAGASLAMAQPWLGSKAPTTQAPAPAGGAPAAVAPAQPAPPAAGTPVWVKPELPTADCCDNCCDTNIAPAKLSCCEDRLWWSASYLNYWLKNSPIPALVTTGTNGTPPGALGQEDTVVLLGDHMTYQTFSGGRLTIGYAIDNLRRTSLEASFFAVGGRSVLFSAASDENGSPVLARPFFATTAPEAAPELLPGEAVHLISAPGLFVGNVRVNMDMDLFGAEVGCSHSCLDVGPLAVDVLFGARYLYMCETLDIQDRSLSIGGDLFFNGVPLGVFNPDTQTFESNGFAVATHDRVRTVNHFYGAQIGLRGEYSCDCWYVSGKLKCALGVTHETVHVEGDTTAIFPDGTTVQTQGGVLALATNIGRRESSDFAVVPEAEINIGFYLNERVRVYAGYTFLYWSNVARPGEQLDRNVNPSFLPTADTTAFGSGPNPANPRPLLEKTDFFLHGITAGFEYHY